MVTHMLRHIMTTPLASVCNWQGKGSAGKKGIGNFGLIQAVKGEYTSVYTFLYISKAVYRPPRRTVLKGFSLFSLKKVFFYLFYEQPLSESKNGQKTFFSLFFKPKTFFLMCLKLRYCASRILSFLTASKSNS